MHPPRDHYRAMALEFVEMSESVSEPNFKRELLYIAMDYAALAEKSAMAMPSEAVVYDDHQRRQRLNHDYPVVRFK
jgi:hypothetical protein